MISRKIMFVQIGMLACGLTFTPCKSQPATPKTKIAKLSVNDSAEAKNDARPHLSEAELIKMAELKSKMADVIEPKMMEVHSLQRQMKLAMAMAKGPVDRAELMQLQRRINSINSDIAISRLNFQLDMADFIPADVKERMRSHLLFDATFGPDMVFGGPPPGAGGPPPFCPPPPDFGQGPPQFGPPAMMRFPPGLGPERMRGPEHY